jgi:hypothetical protein
MKRIAFGLVTILALCACAEDERQRDLDDSRARWEERRDSIGGTYAYHRTSPGWIPFGATTRFEVRANAVVERSYEARDASGQPKTTWTETGAALGSHPEGDPVKTVDQLYDECERTVLTVDEDKNDVHVRYDDDGFLVTCTYSEKGRSDGPTYGVNLSLDLVRPL